MTRTTLTTSEASSLGRQVAGGAGWSLAARVIVAALGLVTSAILARALPPAQMATFLIVSSLVAFAALVAGAGVNQLCIRYVAEHLARGEAVQARHSLRMLLPIGLTCAVVGAIGSVGVSDVVGAKLYTSAGISTGRLSILVGGWVLVSAIQSLMSDSFRGLSDIRAASIYGGPLASALLVVGLLGVAASGADLTVASALMLALLAAAASSVPGALALRARVHRLAGVSTESISRLRVPSVLAVSVPLLLTTAMLVLLGSVDLWILGASQPDAAVAAYGVAARTATVVGMPLLVIYGVLPPMIAGLYARGQTVRLQRMLRACATIAVVPAASLAVVFAVAGGSLLVLVYGAHYRAGAFPLGVLSAGQVVSVGTGVCGIVLAMTGHQRLMLSITAVSASATIAALLLLVPVWGTTAAAVVSALGVCGQNIGMLVAARRKTGMWTHAASPSSLRLLRQVLR